VIGLAVAGLLGGVLCAALLVALDRYLEGRRRG
jgi:hypothetical protein